MLFFFLDVERAEGVAVLRGLEWARDKGIKVVAVESDSKTLVSALWRPSNRLTYFGRILDEINLLTLCFDSVQFLRAHIFCNCVAHRLAKFGLSCETPYFSIFVPGFLSNDVIADLRR